ncbi:MAG: TolB family protein [Longimicrobiales bacterium]
MTPKHFIRLSPLLSFFLTATLYSQSLPPASDIYVGNLSVFDGLYYLDELENITNRRNVYDNQPSFTPDSRSILYTASYGDQTEIHRYYLASGRTTRITRTAESEYSPSSIPGDRALSVVRVEQDANQRLWRFTMEGMDQDLLLPNIAPVGYHEWANPETVLLFVLGSPPTLQTANVLTENSEVLAENIGRILKKIPNRDAWSFVQKTDQNEGWISSVTTESGQIEPLVRTLNEDGFHAWTSEGVLLGSQGKELYQWNPSLEDNWRKIADLSYLSGPISRIAISPNSSTIAVVVDAVP